MNVKWCVCHFRLLWKLIGQLCGRVIPLQVQAALRASKPHSLCNNTMQIYDNTHKHTQQILGKTLQSKNASMHIYYVDVHSPTVPHHRLSELRSLINQLPKHQCFFFYACLVGQVGQRSTWLKSILICPSTNYSVTSSRKSDALMAHCDIIICDPAFLDFFFFLLLSPANMKNK